MKGFENITGFRPQQGLLIMNSEDYSLKKMVLMFPSPTGVTYYEWKTRKMKGFENITGFRPQQGLLIMNSEDYSLKKMVLMFPSPTGVTYYEYSK